MEKAWFKRIKYEEWQKGKYEPLAIIKYSAEELSERYKLEFEIAEEDGLGTIKEARCITCLGNQFALIQYLQSPEPYKTMTNVIGLYDVSTMTQQLEHILELLNLSLSELIWISPKIHFLPYELWRQDDNGVKYLIGVFPNKLDALKSLQEFESFHHKQTYWLQLH